MNITAADLLDGESLIQTKNANAIIRIDEYRLSRLSFDQLMWMVGMKDKEMILCLLQPLKQSLRN
jgi:hypothetical protein